MDISSGCNNSSSKILSGYNLIRQCVKEQRPTLDKLWQNIFNNEIPLYNGNLIEISASENCNKSYLLYKLMAYTAATMNYYEQNNYCEIIFIDLMYKFDIELFINEILKPILREMQLKRKEYEIIANESAKVPEPEAGATAEVEENFNIDKILQSITIYNCYTSDELEISLNEIERLLWHNSNIGLLIIDGVMEDLYDSPLNILSKLQSIGQNLNVCCIYAKRFHNFNDDTSDLGYIYLRDCHDLSIISQRSFPFQFNHCLPFLLNENV